MIKCSDEQAPQSASSFFRPPVFEFLENLLDLVCICGIILLCNKYPNSLMHNIGLEGRLGVRMSNVIVKENETLDSALRRFKRNCAKAGIQQEIRKREHYEKPSVKRKKKSEAARKRKYN